MSELPWEGGMQALKNLNALRDRIIALSESHTAFFKFFESATDNLERSGGVDVRSPDYNNLSILVDLFAKDFNFRMEEIEKAIAELNILIDR